MWMALPACPASPSLQQSDQGASNDRARPADAGVGRDRASPDRASPDRPLEVHAGHARFATVGESTVLDARRSILPGGCAISWTAASSNPGPSTISNAGGLTPQVIPKAAGAHRFTLGIVCGKKSGNDDTVVYAFTRPLPSWPDQPFVAFEDGVAGDNVTTGAQGRLYAYSPAQHPKVKGPATEVWVDVIGKRLKMQKSGNGDFTLWVEGASLDADHHYWVFLAENRFAVAPVPGVSVSAVGNGFELEGSVQLMSAFGNGAAATYGLYPDPANSTTPTVTKLSPTRFRVDGPLAARHLFYLVAETASHRSIPTLITLPPPTKPAARPDLGVIYQIFVRHFADGSGDGVGDLDGLRAKLDYLANDLGVSTLLLMPIFATPGPAWWGYAPGDYSKVHPEYGTMQTLALLIKDARARGLRVLIDIPLNHVHKSYPAFAQAVGDPTSPASSWFHFFGGNQSWFSWDYKDDGARESFFAAGQSEDVTVNLDNPDARAELLGHVRRVLDLDGDGNPTDGADGLRLDYAKGPSLDFWRAVAEAAQGVNPQVALAGEAWTGNAKELGDYLRQAGFNSVFDFSAYYAIRAALKDRKADPLYYYLGEAKTHYTGEGYPIVFVSNHDVNRVISDLSGESFGTAMAAASIVLTAPGNPLLFAGDELGLLAHASSSLERKNGGAFPWGAGDKAQTAEPPGDPLLKPPSLAAQKGDPNSLFAHHQALLKLRKQHAPLREAGAPGYHYGEFTDAALYAMVRPSGKERVLVVVNLSSDYRTVAFSELGKSTKLYSQGLGSGNTIGPHGTHIYKLP
jgi:alpha-glucosidase